MAWVLAGLRSGGDVFFINCKSGSDACLGALDDRGLSDRRRLPVMGEYCQRSPASTFKHVAVVFSVVMPRKPACVC